MNARRVWIVGAGKRVRETALPAFLSLPGRIEVAGVYARGARELEAAGRRFAIRALSDARAADFGTGDVVYVAVGKDAVPAVLERLAQFDRARLELLIDTPVLKIKHVRHAHLLEGWKRAGVAEDVVHLPWFETVRAAVGDVRNVTFEHSAYAYHGVAQAKALCGARVVCARRVKLGQGAARREVELDGGRRAAVIEPRDYAHGRVIVEGLGGRLTDRLEAGEAGAVLAPILEQGTCVGFRAGDVTTRLAPEEIALLGPDAPGASVIARMESMKRVAFRRLAAEVAAGRGGYPIEDGLEDMAVDWFLERFGRWSAGGLRDLRRPAARRLWSGIGRLAR
ncbi:MAG: hypothetical protein NTY35_08110 [Planctomycetota bacterium]|nr:hypothetical protein [Planctomycetota bacterium]